MSKLILWGMIGIGILGGTGVMTVAYDQGAKQAWPVAVALAAVEAALAAVWILK